jgi:hypothetical protein
VRLSKAHGDAVSVIHDERKMDPDCWRQPMSMTFQKRQKELKRQEKQRAKMEKREQRKAAKRAEEAQGAATAPSSETEQPPQSDSKRRVQLG